MAKKTSIGAIIKLDGESTFRASIQNCKTSVAAMKAELEGIKSQYKDNANGLEALSAVYDKYAEIQDEAAKSVKKTSDIFEASKKKQRETKEIMNEMLSVYEKAEKELSEMKKSGTASADAIEAQEKAVEQAKAEYEKYATAVEKCGARTNFFKKALAEASREQQDAAIAMQEYAVYIREAEESADGCATSIDKYGKKIEESGDAAEKAGGAMEVFKGSLAADFAAKGLEKVCDLLKTAAEYSVDVGSNFESSMSKVEAISGASAMQMQDLTKKAETVGKESKRFSASDAADALQYMALAGWETRDMLNSIDGVINLAEASEMDLAKASDIVTDYITAFGLSSKDAAHFVDIMAYAMSNSNTNTEQLGEAYKNVAATAGSFGYSVEDTTAALMVMANAGVKGGEAGTALNAIMTRLATNSSGCADELKKYGISVYDSAGKIKPLSSIILGISSAFSSLTDAESANLAKIIAGQEHYAALNTLITGSSEAAERSGQSFNQYADALERCTGTAEEMSAVMTDNLKGDFAELGSAVEALGIAAYDYIDGPIRSVVDGVTDGVNKVTDAIKREETELDVFTTLAKRHSDEVSANKKTSDYAYAEKMAEAEKVKYYMNIIKETQQSSDVSEYTKFQVGEAISYLSEYSEEISQYNGRVAEIFEISDDELMRIDSSLKKAQEKVKKTAVQSRRDALMMSKAEAELAIAEQKAILKKLEPMALEARADAGKALDDTGFFIGKHLGAAYYATQYDDDIRDADKIIAEQEAIIAKNEESLALLEEISGASEKTNEAMSNGATKTTAAIDDTVGALTDEEQAIRDTAYAWFDSEGKMKEITFGDALTQQITEATEKIVSFKDAFIDSLKSVDIFASNFDLAEIYQTNPDEVLDNMLSRGSDALWLMRDYVDDMNTLKEAGLSDEAMSYLAGHGLGMYQEINALSEAAKTGDDAFEEFQRLYDEALSYQQGTNGKVEEMLTTYADSIMGGVQGGYDAWYEFGIESSKGLFDALDRIKAGLQDGSLSIMGGDWKSVFSNLYGSQYKNTHTNSTDTVDATGGYNDKPVQIQTQITVELDGKSIANSTNQINRDKERMTGYRR